MEIEIDKRLESENDKKRMRNRGNEGKI